MQLPGTNARAYEASTSVTKTKKRFVSLTLGRVVNIKKRALYLHIN